MENKKMNKNLLWIFVILSLFSTNFVSSANVGVSPANIDFVNVLRNGYAERPIIITIDAENPVDVNISTRGEIADWFNFSQTNFSVSRGSPKQIMVSVSPPFDVPNGVYEGFVRIQSTKLGDSIEGHATGLIIPALDVFVRVEITDQEIFKCQASNFGVTNAEKGEDIIFTMDVLNEGNIRINPRISLDVWDQESTTLFGHYEFSESQVIPTRKDKIIFSIPTDNLEIGQYWADVSAVDCSASLTLTFDVLEEGALWANGILEGVLVTPWAKIDDIVPIKAKFRNTGEKALSARFKGQVFFENKIIQLLENDEDQLVLVNEDSEFQFFFTPKKAGKYIISGRVFYNNKRTYEQSAVLNVEPKYGPLGKIIRTGAYIILIIIITILLFKIRKERRAYFRRLKRR